MRRLVGQTVGSPAARVRQAKTAVKGAAVVGVGVVAAGLAAVKAVTWSLHHPLTIVKFMLMGSLLPLYAVHHVDQSLQRALHRATASMSCAGQSPVPVGGVKGDAALAGSAVHSFATSAVDATHIRSIIIHGSRLAGETVGTVWRVFNETLNGAPRPMETVPAIPPANLVGFGCCPVSPSVPSGGLVSLASNVTPGDTPEVAAGHAAISAGFTGNDVAVAIAVAGAESSYQPTATNLNSNGTTDYGEWQINSIHPDVLATGDWRRVGDNARMARSIFNDSVRSGLSGWTPWATFNSGRYLTWMPQARQAVASMFGFVGPQQPLPAPRFNARAIAAPCAPPQIGGPGFVNFRPGLPQVEAAIRFALAQLGKPYVWGATGPSSYDCSGLTQAAYAAAGVTIGRVTTAQVMDGVGVPVGALQRGDLLFPDSGHVELALGDGTAVQAPHTGDVVKISPVPTQLWAVRRIVGISLAAA